MDPITIALSLAQFAPSIMRFMGAGSSSVDAAKKVVDIACCRRPKTEPLIVAVPIQN
jgi:hypothetical protein